MQENNNRNTIIFVVSAVLILIAYQFFVLDPAAKKRSAEAARQKAVAAEVQAASGAAPALPGAPSANPGPVVVSRQDAAAASARASVGNRRNRCPARCQPCGCSS